MRADRLLSIMLLLQAQGKTTTAALAETLEVSRRTILRDIEALSIAGVPIQTESGHGGGVALDEHYRVSLTGLKEAEVRALFVSTRPGPLRDVGLGHAAEGSLLKLLAALPSLHRHEAERVQQRIHLDPAWWWHKGDTLPHLETLRSAVFDDRRVRVRYERGDSEITERTLDPYSLVAKASVWYLIARREGEFRTYRVSRFLAVEPTDERFDRDPTFHLATYWDAHASTFVANLPQFTVTLRLPTEKVRFLRLYAAGRYTLHQPDPTDAHCLVELRLSALEEAQMLVLGLGAEAEIIAPDSLREAVLHHAQHIVAALSAKPPEPPA